MSANSKNWVDLLDLHFDKRLRDFVHTSFPAKITKVVSSGVVDVQPLVGTQRPDESHHPYPEIFNVRMQTYACQMGDVFISLPIKVGDLVWVMVSERDTLNLMKSDGSRPLQSTTQRTHDMSDCFCIPAFFPDKVAKQYDTDALVIANKSSFIRITDQSIEIQSDTKVSINSPMVSINGV